MAWSLEHCKYFILGCQNLLVSTDHQPLLGLLNTKRDLASIQNNRLCELKERTFPYSFFVQYNPGKWHRGPDAFSRNPVKVCGIEHVELEDDYTEAFIETIVMEKLKEICSVEPAPADSNFLSLENIKLAAAEDSEYQLLIETIKKGFPNTRSMTDPKLRQYFSVKDRLSLIKYNIN